MAYGDFKDLTRKTASDKIFLDKTFNIAENPEYDGYQGGLASMVYKVFDQKISGGAATLANKSAIKIENVPNKEFAEELHEPIIRKFNKRKVHSPFKDNIWDGDLADMQLISKFNKGFRVSYVTDIFSKYA